MANGATLDPLQITILVGGYKITGFESAENGFSADYDEDRMSSVVGSRGLGAWIKNHNRSATITLNIMANSEDNDALNAFFQADQVTPGGVLIPLVATSQGHRTLATAQVRIVRPPAINHSAVVRTWTLRTTKLVASYGGIVATPVITSVAEAQALIAAASPIPDAT